MSNKKKNAIMIILVILIIVLFGIICMLAKMVRDRRDVQPVTTITPTPTKTQSEPTATAAQTKTAETSKLDFQFLKLENNGKNEIYSPLSIKYALKMLEEGTSGTTKEQIEKYTKNLNLTKYENIDKVLSLANGIYVRDTYKEFLKEEYKNTLIQKYNAEVNYDKFENADNINNWIENKTLGIIKNMLDDSVVQNPEAEVILVNALAIDMAWENRFDEAISKDFTLANGTKMKAATLYDEITNTSASYYKDDEVTSATIDLQKYNDTQLEFIAIMPNNNKLSDYIKEFTTEKLDKIRKNSTLAFDTNYGIGLSIPKFSFNYNLKLKDDLIDMGITDVFDAQNADLSNMSSKKLHIAEALHKADIKFSETGIKAAATTVMVAMDYSVMFIEKNKPEEVTIDKPFLFVIRDKYTGEIWFTGAVYEPEEWKEIDTSDDTLLDENF